MKFNYECRGVDNILRHLSLVVFSKKLSEYLLRQANRLDELDEKLRLTDLNMVRLKTLVVETAVRVDALESNASSNDIGINSKMKPLEDNILNDARNKEIENVKELGSNIKFDILDSVRRKNNLIFEKVPEGLEPINLIKDLANELDIEGTNDFTVSYAHK